MKHLALELQLKHGIKPYRFWLPAIGVLLSSLLIVLENSVGAENIPNVLNELINWPASAALGMIPYCCFQGDNVFGYRTWLIQFLFLSLVVLWWYLAGLELDLGLLRLLAAKAFMFRIFWFVIAACFQVLAIAILVMINLEHRPNPIHHLLDYIMIGVFYSLEIGWLEVIAWRFWRAARAGATLH